jgi:tetratricopeptide (TPR) repeat protein
MNSLARAYQDAGKLNQALPLYALTLEKRKAKLGPDHPQTLQSMTSLAWVHGQAKRYGEAELLYKEAIALARGKFPAGSLEVASPLDGLGYCLLQTGTPAEAVPLLREALAIRAKKAPDAWTTFYTQSMLGDALLGQKKYAEAEPLLLAGYEGMKQREAKIPASGKVRLTEALERLVQLYEATGQKDKADVWRKKLVGPKQIDSEKGSGKKDQG